MDKVIEIRQYTNRFAENFSVDNAVKKSKGYSGGMTVFPHSKRVYVVRTNTDGTYITGLEGKECQKEKERCEKILGVDLSPTSSYWESFPMPFHTPDGTMTLDLKEPKNYIFYKAALANNILMPDYETVKDKSYENPDIIYYIHDEGETEKKKSSLTQLKDQVGAILIQFRDQKERLLYLCYALGKSVNDSFSKDNLYNILSQEKENKTKADQLQNYIDFLGTSAEKLQAMYYGQKGVEKRIIQIDPVTSKYTFNGVVLGRTLAELKDFLAADANLELLVMIQNEINSK